MNNLEKKKIVIISYTFPPNEGIGGRRWAKFAKKLFNSGHNVKIITSNSNNSISNWTKDITSFKNEILRIPFNYPESLNKYPKTLLAKLTYRKDLLFVKSKVEGNYYDRSQFVGITLLDKVEGLINNGYDNVIVTVAPFHLATQLTALKTKYPRVNFIVDFRDPWIDNKTSYGYEGLSNKRKEYEINSEEKVASIFDHVVSVSETMTQYFINKYSYISKNKFITIPNGFDLEDYESFTKNSISNNTKIKLVFVGTFYNKASHYLELLKNQLSRLKKENFQTYQLLQISFYGPCDIDTSDIEELHSNVTFNGVIEFNQVKSILSTATAALLFLTDDINYSFSTKFCEYIAANLPILVFGKRGKTIDFIEANNIGAGISTNEENHLIRFTENLKSYSNSFASLDKSEFDIDALVLKYSKLFI